MSDCVVRIMVIGGSGSGKSTAASRLAETLGLPYVPTDHVFWAPDWRPTPREDQRRWLDAATRADRWVLDGNFDGDADILWARAELAVWLDLPRGLTVGRALRRNLGWWLSRAPVWGGRRMTLRRALGGARHAFRSHGLKRARYPEALSRFSGLQVVRLTSAGAVEAWLRDASVEGLIRRS